MQYKFLDGTMFIHVMQHIISTYVKADKLLLILSSYGTLKTERFLLTFLQLANSQTIVRQWSVKYLTDAMPPYFGSQKLLVSLHTLRVRQETRYKLAADKYDITYKYVPNN